MILYAFRISMAMEIRAFSRTSNMMNGPLNDAAAMPTRQMELSVKEIRVLGRCKGLGPGKGLDAGIDRPTVMTQR